jgi:NAD(P)-dependent dehydrogenase (short-subunit alcohol dehydrogenase family)
MCDPNWRENVDVAQSVVVTGSGAGLGRAIAHRLAQDGWVVIGIDVAAKEGAPDPGCRAVIRGDVTEPAVHERAAEIARSFAPLVGWVNNAGVGRSTPLHNLDEADARVIVGINGLGSLWGCATVVSAFIDQVSGGSIVNIGSIHGQLSSRDRAVYEFTKGGVEALARGIAVSYGPFGIRANTVAPGGIRTPHLAEQITNSLDPESEERSLAQGPPMRRIAEPAEIASVVAFLLGPESSYLSGASIAVDGAWSAVFGTVRPDLDLYEKYGLTP